MSILFTPALISIGKHEKSCAAGLRAFAECSLASRTNLVADENNYSLQIDEPLEE
jgi:hypothetical protein